MKPTVKKVFDALAEALSSIPESDVPEVVNILSAIRGPDIEPLSGVKSKTTAILRGALPIAKYLQYTGLFTLNGVTKAQLQGALEYASGKECAEAAGNHFSGHVQQAATALLAEMEDDHGTTSTGDES